MSEISIKKEFDNRLLGRKEVKARVENDGATMKRLDVKSKVAKAMKQDESLVVVTKVETNYGDRDMEVEAHVYDNTDSLENVEKNYIKKRNTAPAAEEGGEE